MTAALLALTERTRPDLVVCSEPDSVALDVFVARELAEEALAEVLRDEPAFEEFPSMLVIDNTPSSPN